MTAYGYTRVSGDRQADSGLGLDAQEAAIRRYYEFRLATQCAWGGVYTDAAVSASRFRFAARPQGRALDALLTAGDHVLIAKLDRAFRNVADFAATLAAWDRRGIAVHLLDLHVDTSLPTGKLVATIMAAVAEWEARRIGERITDAKAAARERRRTSNGVPPLGWRRLAGNQAEPEDDERATAHLVIELRQDGLAWRAIAAELNRRGIARAAPRNVPRRTAAGWNYQHVRRMYAAAITNFPL